MRKAFKYRLFVNKSQVSALGDMLETHRRLYNECLAQRKETYEKDKKSLSYYDQCRWYTDARKANEFYALINHTSAQGTMRRLDEAFRHFFRRVKAKKKPGYPRFKGRDHFNSITHPFHGNGIRLKGNKLRVQHVGKLRVKVHRPHEGTIKTLTIKREDDKWFVILSCDLGELNVPKHDGPAIGIDVGLEYFLTTSDGEHVKNPRFGKKQLPKLRVAQRSLTRKKRGGKNRVKAVKAVRRSYTKAKNARHDHHHKVALKITRRFGFIAAESLTINNMVRNRWLARSISDVAWGDFLGILEHKAESAGAEVVFVNPRGTSQECSLCGQMVPKTLRDRLHQCPCGCSLHRDINAARNILARGLARAEPACRNVEAYPRGARSRLR